MRKILMLALLLLCTACVQAQPANPSSDKDKASDVTTIQGCLQSAAGIFTLTESNGTTHRLSGYANKLSHQIGREVKITGAPGVKTIDTSQQNIEPSASEIPVFNVKSVTRIADTCKSPAK